MWDEAQQQGPLQDFVPWPVRKEIPKKMMSFARLKANLKRWRSHALKEHAYDKAIQWQAVDRNGLALRP